MKGYVLSAIMISVTVVANAAYAKPSNIIPWPSSLPVYDHIVIVVDENKNYEEVIGKQYAPFINGTLKAEGADFTRMFGEEHFSQGNYYWLFSGDNHNVGFVDRPPEVGSITGPNIASQLNAKGLSFSGYAEHLPADPNTTTDKATGYARKHVPWLSFADKGDWKSLDFSKFPKKPAGFQSLPTVSMVIPGLFDDMHNGNTTKEMVRNGDRWLQDNLGPYYEWAKTHNSLLILTFDENDDQRAYQGLTNPWFAEYGKVGRKKQHLEKINDPELYRDLKNRTITIFAGDHIKPGDYKENRGITHVNILRTIEAMYGLPKIGRQQPNAAGQTFVLRHEEKGKKSTLHVKQGISDDYIITDVFKHTR